VEHDLFSRQMSQRLESCYPYVEALRWGISKTTDECLQSTYVAFGLSWNKQMFNAGYVFYDHRIVE
jgi:hypothetical protein